MIFARRKISYNNVTQTNIARRRAVQVRETRSNPHKKPKPNVRAKLSYVTLERCYRVRAILLAGSKRGDHDDFPVDPTREEQIVIPRVDRKSSRTYLIQHMFRTLYFNLNWRHSRDGIEVRSRVDTVGLAYRRAEGELRASWTAVSESGAWKRAT
jgi:hypothetical protein